MAGNDYRGEGTLVVGEDRYPVRYHLHTFMNRGALDGRGVVENHREGIAAAFHASRAVLEMAHGMSAPIIINQWRPVAQDSDFLLAGSIEVTQNV